MCRAMILPLIGTRFIIDIICLRCHVLLRHIRCHQRKLAAVFIHVMIMCDGDPVFMYVYVCAPTSVHRK